MIFAIGYQLNSMAGKFGGLEGLFEYGYYSLSESGNS
jgi:hypothetical protein